MEKRSEPGSSSSTPVKPNGTIQAVVFDLDGVLIDSEQLAFEVWQEITAQYGGELKQDAFPQMAGMTIEETADFIMQLAGITFDVEQTCALAWQRVIEQLGSRIDPLPGVREMLLELSKRGYPLAIASNSPVFYIENALNGSGLKDCFRSWSGVDEVNAGKPAPDVYLMAARRLGVSPERCLAIEDSRVGVQAAAAAGMRVLAIPAAHDSRAGFDGAWRIFGSMVEVVETLESIL